MLAAVFLLLDSDTDYMYTAGATLAWHVPGKKMVIVGNVWVTTFIDLVESANHVTIAMDTLPGMHYINAQSGTTHGRSVTYIMISFSQEIFCLFFSVLSSTILQLGFQSLFPAIIILYSISHFLV